MTTGSAQANPARFQLTIERIPSERALDEVSQLIYQSSEKTLKASISSTPYTVGRSFSREEALELSEKLKASRISFRFNGKGPNAEVIDYDPNRESQARIEKLDSGASFGKQSVAIIAGLLVFIALIAYFSLSGDQTTETETKAHSSESTSSNKDAQPTAGQAPNKDFDARLTNISGKISYREANSLFWDVAKKDQELQNKDSLRSYDRSTAKILYRGGSEVILRPNTLVIIGESVSEEDNSVARRFQLDDGTVQANILPNSGTSGFEIATNSGTIQIKSPESGALSTRIETSIVRGETKVKVARGEAVFKSKNPEVKPVELKANQAVSAAQDKVFPITDYTPTIKLLSPVNRSKVKHEEGGEQSYLFEWEPSGEESDCTWTLATDEKLESTLLQQKTQKSTIELSYLDSGLLFWGVSCETDGITYKSPTWRVNVTTNSN